METEIRQDQKRNRGHPLYRGTEKLKRKERRGLAHLSGTALLTVAWSKNCMATYGPRI
jgi:hypothetical protein